MWICKDCYKKYANNAECFTDYNFLKLTCFICEEGIASEHLVNPIRLSDYQLKQLLMHPDFDLMHLMKMRAFEFIKTEIELEMQKMEQEVLYGNLQISE